MRFALTLLFALAVLSGCGGGPSIEDQAKEGVQVYEGMKDITVTNCQDIGNDRWTCAVTNHSNGKTATLHFHREVNLQELSITPREVANLLFVPSAPGSGLAGPRLSVLSWTAWPSNGGNAVLKVCGAEGEVTAIFRQSLIHIGRVVARATDTWKNFPLWTTTKCHEHFFVWSVRDRLYRRHDIYRVEFQVRTHSGARSNVVTRQMRWNHYSPPATFGP